MGIGNAFFTVFQNKGYVQGIARTPHASFAVDKAFQPFLDFLAAYIEAADGLFFAVDHTDIGFFFTGRGYNQKRGTAALARNFGKPFAVGGTGTYGLKLEIINGNLCTLYGSGVQYAADGNP